MTQRHAGSSRGAAFAMEPMRLQPLLVVMSAFRSALRGLKMQLLQSTTMGRV
jgi:hypothetical protein